MMRERINTNLIIRLILIAFIGSCATYYSAEYLKQFDLSLFDFSYFTPISSAIFTIYLCISEITSNYKIKKNKR